MAGEALEAVERAEDAAAVPSGPAGAPEQEPQPKHWSKRVELALGTRERNVAPYRPFVIRSRERILAYCRRAGIDTDRLGIPSDEWVREIVEAQLDVARVLPKREQFVLCDNDTWGAEAVAGRPVVPFPGPGRAFLWAPPDDDTAVAELRHLQAEGARYIVFAPHALWWLDYYESFANYLTEHAECVLRNGRVAVFKLAAASPEPPRWHPVRRGQVTRRRAAHALQSLYFTPAVHRLLPDDLAIGFAALVGRALWLHPAIRERAEVRMRVVLDGTSRSGEERALAPRQVVETALRGAVWMRPWYSRGRPIQGLEHLEAARRTGCGVLLVGAHIGMLNVAVSSVAAQASELSLLAGNWIRSEREKAVQNDPIYLARVTWIYRGGAFEQMREILEGGGVCAMSFDLPGGAKTTFLGKPANVARGPAGLAVATGAQVITGWVDRRGLRPFVKLNPPVDPARFASAGELTQHLADTFSEELLRRPEALNADPSLAGVWSDVIGSDAWAFR
jgi:lauroyl/myristoyl acyltransferase